MENLVALSPILIVLLLAVIFVVIIVLIIKRLSKSKNNIDTERRIRELEEENKRLKNSNGTK